MSTKEKRNPTIVVMGLDKDGRPRAAAYPAELLGQAAKAAEAWKLRLGRAENDGALALAQELPQGEKHDHKKVNAPTVTPGVRRLVNAVQKLDTKGNGVSARELTVEMNLHKAGISRHVKNAIGLGFIRNREEAKGKSCRYVIDEGMPSDTAVLPTTKAVERHYKLQITKSRTK